MNQQQRQSSAPFDRLVRALAQQAVNEYLTEQAALRRDSEVNRQNPVPLPDMDKAA